MCCLVHRDWGISIVVEMGWEQTAGWHNHKEKVTVDANKTHLNPQNQPRSGRFGWFRLVYSQTSTPQQRARHDYTASPQASEGRGAINALRKYPRLRAAG